MILVVAATFGGVLAIVLGAYWAMVVHPEERAIRTVRKRLRREGGRAAAPATVRKAEERLARMDLLNRALEMTRARMSPLQVTIEQSGLKITVGALLLACGCLALLVFLVVFRLSRLAPLAAVAAVPSAYLPIAYVKFRRNRRLLQFEEQFPEAIDLIARALRAGHAFTTGVAMVAEEMPEPIGPEFKLLYDQQNFGMPLPDALHEFARRVPILDAQFFATAVLTQREAGGNLSEILDNLATVVRERFRVKRQVRVISAHGRITGWILAGLPPSLAVAFFILSPKHIKLLIGDPLGVQMIIFALTMQVIGTIIIRKIVDVEY